MKATEKKSNKIKELAELAVICAIMTGGKEALNAIPNVHPLMLLIILSVRAYGARALYPVTGFVIIESLLYGLNIWTVSYLYIWPLYALAALLFKDCESELFWGIYAGLCGLLFGALSALPVLLLSGLQGAVAYWVAGIPYDIIHCVSNFVIVFSLLNPLTACLSKLHAGKF